jgi:hypothetical protein
MVTNNFWYSDLPRLHDVVQNNMVLYPKELVVAQLRDFFSHDSFYRYAHDQWGYPKTPDHTDLPQDAGFDNNITTRLFIGESYRFDVVYYPAIIVRHGGSVSVPVSINRETSVFKWGNRVYEDGYGNIAVFPVPEYFIFAGAYEGSINIEIMARDLRTRDDLVDLVSLLFIDIGFNDLQKSGLIVTGVSSGAPTETDDRNDHIFKQTVSLKIRSEWRRQIPIKDVIEVINVGIEFAYLNPPNPPGPIAQNLTIRTGETLMEQLANL